MSVGHKTKKLIWKRDGGCCFYCGEKLTWDTKTVDHVIPKSKGGPHRAWNLVISCLVCNQVKGDEDPATEHLDTVLRWKIAHENRISLAKAFAYAKMANNLEEMKILLELREKIEQIIMSPNPEILDINFKIAA